VAGRGEPAFSRQVELSLSGASGMAQQETRFKRRYSIFLVLCLLLIVLVVVPLLSYAWKAISTSRDYIEESLRERQMKTAIPAAFHIQTLMGGYGRHLRGLANSFEVYANEDDYRKEYEGLLQRNILARWATDETLLIQYLGKEGAQFSVAGNGVSEGDKAQMEAFLAPLGRATLGSGSPQNSGVFFVRAGALKNMSVPAIALCVPLHSKGACVAALSAIYTLESVQDSLVQYSREFSLFVTDDKGNLIFNSDANLQGRQLDMSEDPMVQRVLASGNYPTSTTNYSVTRFGNKKNASTVLVTCAPITEYRWLLFSYVDREKFFAPILELRRQSMIWISLSIFTALIIGIVLARLITKPLSDLTTVSEELAKGHFDRRADIKIRNEIGELGRAFNLMADEIQSYIEKVEAAAAENETLFMSSIRAIANAIDAKDPYTRGHSERVSAYTMIIAREFGLDEKALRVAEIASLLHDVGKIGIEDKILRKPGALTNEEFSIMKTHPAKGADILGSIAQMSAMIPGIRHHHERWAGGGYPDNLRGESIPVLARIIGVADAFDAMTTNRPYQRAMTFQTAAARINELTGSVYEPSVVDAFNRAFRAGSFASYQMQVRESKLA
jgi:HD-GYP domain-containing protein (c-di-GMP phosphodiesterase class II)